MRKKNKSVAFIILVSVYMYIYIYIYIRGGTVHVFVLNCHGTDLSVRCMRPYDEYRQFTPNLEGVGVKTKPTRQ